MQQGFHELLSFVTVKWRMKWRSHMCFHVCLFQNQNSKLLRMTKEFETNNKTWHWVCFLKMDNKKIIKIFYFCEWKWTNGCAHGSEHRSTYWVFVKVYVGLLTIGWYWTVGNDFFFLFLFIYLPSLFCNFVLAEGFMLC